jgi:hypothetical protein
MLFKPDDSFQFWIGCAATDASNGSGKSAWLHIITSFQYMQKAHKTCSPIKDISTFQGNIERVFYPQLKIRVTIVGKPPNFPLPPGDVFTAFFFSGTILSELPRFCG